MKGFRPDIRSLGANYLVAQVVVFLLFCPYLGNLFLYTSRRIYMWQGSDLVVLFAAMIVLAVICLIANQVVRLIGLTWLKRVFDHLFVIALGAGILATLCCCTQREQGYRIAQFGVEMQTAWLLLIGLVGYSLARPGCKLVERCRQLCLIVSPAMLFMAWQLSQLQSYPPRNDPFPTEASTLQVRTVAQSDAADKSGPVYLFILDEWSYTRTFENGRVRPNFSNLSALCEETTVFHQAHAPGERTDYSIPGILLQTNLPVRWEDGKLGFQDGDREIHAKELDPIFTAAENHGYRSFVVHFGVPCPMFIRDRVDVCRSYHFFPHGQSLTEQIGIHTFRAMGGLTDPWTLFILDKLKLKTSLQDKQMLQVHRGIRDDTLRIIREQPSKSFAVIHYPLPHEPYILNPDGSYRGVDPPAWQRNDITGYERNLACLDRFVGELIAEMKKADRFDNATLILTSDHGWRYDPQRTSTLKNEPLTHVPLIVKLPGQTQPMSITTRFEICRLGMLIKSALKQGADVDDVWREIEPRLVDSAPRVIAEKAVQRTN